MFSKAELRTVAARGLEHDLFVYFQDVQNQAFRTRGVEKVEITSGTLGENAILFCVFAAWGCDSRVCEHPQ